MRGRMALAFDRWVRWYPAGWRAENADAMLGVLLDAAEQGGRSRLTPGEKAAMVRNGLAARLRADLPQRIRDGIATASLAAGTALALLVLVCHEVAPGVLALMGHPTVTPLAIAPVPGGFHTYLPSPALAAFGPFQTPLAVVALLWLAGVALAVAGRHPATRALLATATAAALALLILRSAGIAWQGLDSATLTLVLLLGLGALLGRPARARALVPVFLGWLALLAGLYLVTSLLLGADPGDPFTAKASYFVGVVAGQNVIALGVDLALVAALVLLLMRRGAGAAIVVASTVPWGACWLAEVLPQGGLEFFDRFDWSLVVGYLVSAVLIVVRLARGTGRMSAAA